MLLCEITFVYFIYINIFGIYLLSFLYVCMVNTIYLLSFVETLYAIINLRGVSTKLNKYNLFIVHNFI